MQVFLTGGTGFLGSAVIPFLVADSRTEKIHVLVRDSLRENASVRIAKLVERLFSPEHRSLAKLKLVPVVGDLTQLKMGLSEFDYNALATVCTHVLHVGASTDFGAPLGESRLINVEGTRCVLDFATDIKTRNQHFVRFDYVSTAYVAGTKRGLVDEQTLVRGQKFANFYEQSKYEAEVLVRSYMEKIPISIQRPSIVVGDSRNGFTPHFKVLYWPLLLLSKNILPFIPCNPMAMLDIVPVDFVARGIYGLMMNQRSIGQTYHLTAGPENTLRIKAFLDDAFRLTSIQRRPLMPLTMFQLLRSRLFKPMMSQSFWEACDLAAVYSEYIRGTQVQFQNQKTVALLQELGVSPAPLWDQYKSKVFGYCMESHWGKKKSADEYRYRNPNDSIGA